jgi:HEAT repeat protein
VKLARLTADSDHAEMVTRITADDEEDMYIRLEGAAYLAAVCDAEAARLFAPFLQHADPQVQLEAVIALGETNTHESVELISGILDDTTRAYFLRSAAAWALSRTGFTTATDRLIKAFTDVDQSIREEALQGVVTLGEVAVPLLLVGLQEAQSDLASGCAEALRQQKELPDPVLDAIGANLRSNAPSLWTVWLAGHIGRARVARAVAGLDQTAPQLQYAITLLWSFAESWIARRWELNPGPILPAVGEADDVDDTD